MIDIYTEKEDSKDWILQNDLYFTKTFHSKNRPGSLKTE